jgi:glycosyltransferase involved in cell wall biosynthesis
VYNGVSASDTRRPNLTRKLWCLFKDNRISGFPTISVIIPAYNCASTIFKAVGSVLDQTYAGPLEVIVVNDGSPDTKELESALVPFNDRLRYIKQQNRGVSLARNAGILAATGDWLAFLDGDDSWYPNALETLFGVAGDQWDMVYGNGDIVGAGCAPGEKYTDWSPSSGEVTPESLISGKCCVLTSSVLVKRRTVIEAGMFDPSLHHSEDFELWMRIALNGGRITFTTESLMRRVAHTGSQSADRSKMEAGVVKVCERVLARKDASAELKIVTAARLRRAKRSSWKYKVKQSPRLYSVTKNPVWCYFRHTRTDGVCLSCNRSWKLS